LVDSIIIRGLLVFSPLLHSNKAYVIQICIIFRKLCPILTAAEGFILGVGAKIFTVAGPVILYGTVAGVIYGVIYWVIKIITGA